MVVRKVDGALLGGGGDLSEVWALATTGSYDRVVIMGGGRHEVIPVLGRHIGFIKRCQ